MIEITKEECNKCQHPLTHPVPHELDNKIYCDECAFQCIKCNKTFVANSKDQFICKACSEQINQS